MHRLILLMVAFQMADASLSLSLLNLITYMEGRYSACFTMEKAEAQRDYTITKVVRKEGQRHISRSAYLQSFCSFNLIMLVPNASPLFLVVQECLLLS